MYEKAKGISKFVSTSSLAPNISCIEKYENNKIILTFLYNAYKSLGVPSPYAKLTRSTMWEWFTKKGELKENYMEATLEQQ
jgi:hypothetical protein